MRYDKNTEYWNDPTRYYLYPIPDDNEYAVWNELNRECSRDSGGCIRVLKASSTPGYAIYSVDRTGLARVVDWTYLVDLLYLDPVGYFLEHPRVNSIYIETDDLDGTGDSSAGTDPSRMYTVGHDSQSAASRGSSSRRTASIAESQASGNAVPNYALVVHRSELDSLTLRCIHNQQIAFFTTHNIALPPARDFVATLHGR